MKGLHFIQQKVTEPIAPQRVDIACFVGFVEFRGGEIPHAIVQTLRESGWLNFNDSSPSPYFRASAQQLRDIPVPIESWETFDQLFDWESRTISESLQCATWLGAAVKAFFAEGGRKCYIINAGAPYEYNLPQAQRLLRIPELLPGYSGSASANRNDRSSWHGVAHLFGLPEVSFLCLPDLVDICRGDQSPYSTEYPEPPLPEEQFVECSQGTTEVLPDNSLMEIRPPQYGEADYELWQTLIGELAERVRQLHREVQLITSIPLPHEQARAASRLPDCVYQYGWFSRELLDDTGMQSAFVQLNYPWLKTRYDNFLPQGLQPGEGSLVGLLAKNALTRGTFRSAVPVAQQQLIDIYPKLSLAEISAPRMSIGSAAPGAPLEDRVSLWHVGAYGQIKLRSDVTTSNSVIYRNASVSRTMAMILRFCRHLGEEFIFERNGEQLWRKITDRLEGYLAQLYQIGVLDGRTERDAYSVHCDRSIMTQYELDKGIVKAEVVVNITASLETMIIAFSVQGNNETGLLAEGAA